MVDFVRAANPIWFFVDHAGQPLDDTYYAFFLQNDLPYAPQPVYQTPTGTEWANPLELQPSGTLPNNLYFDPELIYRIEIRAGNTQNAQLIWLIENFIPGGGEDPIDGLSINADNQITNPQFSLISFNSPLSGSASGTVEIAPGWDLILTGSGTYAITQIPLNADDDVPTNASYALEFSLVGWTTAVLRQRFEQNGLIWGGKYLNAQLTGRISSAVSSSSVSARLVRSNGDITALFNNRALTSAYNTVNATVPIPDSDDTTDPPASYTELQIVLPTTADTTITSVQLVPTDAEGLLAYEQETIERQQDHTFHYYRESIILQPKSSILTGWDFGLNPWQSRSVANSNVATNEYTADQTVIIQQNYVENNVQNNVAVAQASSTNQMAFRVRAVTAANRFAILQYIDSVTSRPYWDGVLSSVVRAKANKTADTLQIKMRLIYRSGLPATISRTNPIALWSDSDGSEPVLAAGWSYLTPKNDPAYNLDGDWQDMVFERFELPAMDNSNMTLGVLIYTLQPMIESTPDDLYFGSVSLVPNEFALAVNPLTFDETLRQCRYYYETTFPLGGGVPVITTTGALNAPMTAYYNGVSTDASYPNSFGAPWLVIKRASPTVAFYSTSSTTAGRVEQRTTTQTSGDTFSEVVLNTYWNTPSISVNGYLVVARASGGALSSEAAGGITHPGAAAINYHYIANSRLGS